MIVRLGRDFPSRRSVVEPRVEEEVWGGRELVVLLAHSGEASSSEEGAGHWITYAKGVNGNWWRLETLAPRGEAPQLSIDNPFVNKDITVEILGFVRRKKNSARPPVFGKMSNSGMWCLILR